MLDRGCQREILAKLAGLAPYGNTTPQFSYYKRSMCVHTLTILAYDLHALAAGAVNGSRMTL